MRRVGVPEVVGGDDAVPARPLHIDEAALEGETGASAAAGDDAGSVASFGFGGDAVVEEEERSARSLGFGGDDVDLHDEDDAAPPELALWDKDRAGVPRDGFVEQWRGSFGGRGAAGAPPSTALSGGFPAASQSTRLVRARQIAQSFGVTYADPTGGAALMARAMGEMPVVEKVDAPDEGTARPASCLVSAPEDDALRQAVCHAMIDVVCDAILSRLAAQAARSTEGGVFEQSSTEKVIRAAVGEFFADPGFRSEIDVVNSMIDLRHFITVVRRYLPSLKALLQTAGLSALTPEFVHEVLGGPVLSAGSSGGSTASAGGAASRSTGLFDLAPTVLAGKIRAALDITPLDQLIMLRDAFVGALYQGVLKEGVAQNTSYSAIERAVESVTGIFEPNGGGFFGPAREQWELQKVQRFTLERFLTEIKERGDELIAALQRAGVRIGVAREQIYLDSVMRRREWRRRLYNMVALLPIQGTKIEGWATRLEAAGISIHREKKGASKPITIRDFVREAVRRVSAGLPEIPEQELQKMLDAYSDALSDKSQEVARELERLAGYFPDSLGLPVLFAMVSRSDPEQYIPFYADAVTARLCDMFAPDSGSADRSSVRSIVEGWMSAHLGVPVEEAAALPDVGDITPAPCQLTGAAAVNYLLERSRSLHQLLSAAHISVTSYQVACALCLRGVERKKGERLANFGDVLPLVEPKLAVDDGFSIDACWLIQQLDGQMSVVEIGRLKAIVQQAVSTNPDLANALLQHLLDSTGSVEEGLPAGYLDLSQVVPPEQGLWASLWSEPRDTRVRKARMNTAHRLLYCAASYAVRLAADHGDHMSDAVALLRDVITHCVKYGVDLVHDPVAQGIFSTLFYHQGFRAALSQIMRMSLVRLSSAARLRSLARYRCETTEKYIREPADAGGAAGASSADADVAEAGEGGEVIEGAGAADATVEEGDVIATTKDPLLARWLAEAKAVRKESRATRARERTLAVERAEARIRATEPDWRWLDRLFAQGGLWEQDVEACVFTTDAIAVLRDRLADASTGSDDTPRDSVWDRLCTARDGRYVLPVARRLMTEPLLSLTVSEKAEKSMNDVPRVLWGLYRVAEQRAYRQVRGEDPKPKPREVRQNTVAFR